MQSAYLDPILIKLECGRQGLANIANIKFHENPFSGDRVVRCGKTDIFALVFRNAPKTGRGLCFVYLCIILIIVNAKCDDVIFGTFAVTCKIATIVSAVSPSIHLKNVIFVTGCFTIIYQSIHIVFKIMGTLPETWMLSCANLRFHWLIMHRVFIELKNVPNSYTEKWKAHSLPDSLSVS